MQIFGKNNNDTYLFETFESYQTKNHEYNINQKNLDIDKTIKYYINNNEFEIAKKILNKSDEKELLEYIITLEKDVEEVPFNIKLIGNEEFEVHKDFQLLESKLIINNFETSENLLEQLISELNTCDNFDIIVSFIKNSGLNTLVSTFNNLNKRGIRGRIITTTYMSVTDAAALRTLLNFDNIKLKIYESSNSSDSFHTKGYIFHRHDGHKDGLSSVIIGSSNLSEVALKTAEEWNLRTYKRESDNIFDETWNRFEAIWNHPQTHEVTEGYIKQYEKFIKDKNILRPYFYTFNSTKEEDFSTSQSLVPNSMQKEALKNLELLVQQGGNKALAIAATGTGKTFLSAWCAKQLNPSKVLFIAHQDELLNGAMKTFKQVYNKYSDDQFGKFKGQLRENKKFTFASIQTLANHYTNFSKEEFDLIIIDEFHHASANSYQKIIDYFEPQFLLGLTATPERADGNNIYELVDNNIIINVRLREALEHELLVPFQYYGINDDYVELEQRDKLSEEELLAALVKHNNERVDFIIDNINKYAIAGKRKCIGFCQNIKHAEMMTREFNEKGFTTVCITGNNSFEERTTAIKRLQNDNDPLEIIFTVDLFNEGVDIPQINLILFLRPTKSPVIFTQQLGRGLRRHQSKEMLVVLDFVINDSNNYMIPIALIGEKNFKNKSEIRAHVKRNLKDLSKYMHIELDKKSKEKILRSLENFNPYGKREIIKEIKTYVSEISNDNRCKQLNILDFENDNAPNLSLIFKVKGLSNLSLINKTIKNERKVDSLINKSERLTNLFNNITYFLPVRRLFDFIVYTNTLINGKVNLLSQKEYIEEKLEVELNNLSLKKLEIAIERTANKYKDIFEIQSDFIVSKDQYDEKILNEIKMYQTFGLNQYHKTMKVDYLNHFIPFEFDKEYTTLDLADMMRDNPASGSWMRGFESRGNHHFILVTINKGEDKKKVNHDYEDYFINNKKFHWESSSSVIETNKVKSLIQNTAEEHHFHLLVRRKAKDVFTQPYKYHGEVEFESMGGDQPINVIWKLKNPVSKFVLEEYLNK
ncbi:DNA repair helicase [Macrococcus hajekii]|nr:DUF3427 domain-containing protein [Macrococcus hajekii]GGB02556.1 DNA repair helicase [Macrococcus hajekii]